MTLIVVTRNLMDHVLSNSFAKKKKLWGSDKVYQLHIISEKDWNTKVNFVYFW